MPKKKGWVGRSQKPRLLCGIIVWSKSSLSAKSAWLVQNWFFLKYKEEEKRTSLNYEITCEKLPQNLEIAQMCSICYECFLQGMWSASKRWWIKECSIFKALGCLILEFHLTRKTFKIAPRIYNLRLVVAILKTWISLPSCFWQK